MTFLEAAIEVLRREGRPLPPKRLAELAVKHNLLSVVGRDPEGTMAERLDAHLAKDAFRSDLVRLQAGLYGLKIYPPKSEVVVEPEAPEAEADGPEGPEDAAEAAEAAVDGPRRGRSRRRQRGKKPIAVASGASEAKPEPNGAQLELGVKADEPKAAPADPAKTKKAAPVEGEASTEGEAEPAEGERRARRRSRRGARGRREEDPTTPAEPVVVAETTASPDELAEMEQLDEEFELSSGPVIAPTAGSEESFRSDDDRVLREEIPGRPIGDDRDHGRHRRERGHRGGPDRGRNRDGKRPDGPREARPHEARPQESRPQESRPQPAPKPHAEPHHKPMPVAPSSGKVVPVLDAVAELFRQGDVRPQSVTQLAEALMKNGRVDARGGQPELVRQVRAALVRDGRERESEGLRARFLNLGGGLFASVEKRLESELLPIERELAERAARLRDATKATLRRRLPKLAPAAFEALNRALLDKLGLQQVELVRRGDGVAYFGAQRPVGMASLKILIGIRSGDAEISARAIAELKAGMQVRGYDEGILLCAGRPSPEASAEVKSVGGLQIHDGLSVAQLLQKHGLGVRRLLLPVDYLDLELLHELSEA